jgi:hypothetical protein
VSNNTCNEIDTTTPLGYEKNAAILLNLFYCAYENRLLHFQTFGGSKYKKRKTINKKAKTKKLKKKHLKTNKVRS